eukprot:3585137-Amphidinium_carterae.1
MVPFLGLPCITPGLPPRTCNLMHLLSMHPPSWHVSQTSSVMRIRESYRILADYHLVTQYDGDLINTRAPRSSAPHPHPCCTIKLTVFRVRRPNIPT